MNFGLTQMPRFQGTPHNVFEFLNKGLNAIRGTMAYAAYVWEANPDPEHSYPKTAGNELLNATEMLRAEQLKLKELIACGPSGWVSKDFEWRVAHLGHNKIPAQCYIIEALLRDPKPNEAFDVNLKRNQRTSCIRTYCAARRITIQNILSMLTSEHRWNYQAKHRRTVVGNPFYPENMIRIFGVRENYFTDPLFQNDVIIVLTNLIENALKYSGSDLPDVRLQIRVDKIVVLDKGTGMSPAFVARLNDPDDLEPHREDGTISDGVTNTGTGWTTIKRLMAKHSHRYLVESEKGKGTKVTLFLEKGDITELDSNEPLTDAFIPADKILPIERIVEATAVFRGAQPLAGWQWVQHEGACMLDVSESPFYLYLPFAQDLVGRIQLSP